MKAIVILIVAFLLAQFANCQSNVTITSKPEKLFIEKGDHILIINSDFLVTNNSADSLTLTKLSLNVFDNNNVLVYSRFLDNNGTSPSILTIPNRNLNGTSSQLIFNPFTDFSSSLPLYKLVYEFIFEANDGKEMKVETTVLPTLFKQKEVYAFPLKGKVLVYDAHDLYAHHRRFDYEFTPIKGLGFKTNFMRYAFDFVYTEGGKQFKTNGKKDEDYYGWGKPVYAIGAGKVIYASNNHKDDKTFNIPGLATNAMELYGNCIAILHSDSTVSVYGHLKQNSLRLKIGDITKARQEIAAIGVSGSSFFPHLHFELRTSIDHNAEGLPIYFSNVFLVEGNKKSRINSGLVQTGTIIEAW